MRDVDTRGGARYEIPRIRRGAASPHCRASAETLGYARKCRVRIARERRRIRIHRRTFIHRSTHCTAPRMYTPVVEDYLKAIWMLQQAESPVSTSRIAERLGLSAAAVTAMV